MSDGKSASITAPNGSAQEKLIKRALDASGINTTDVDYIEAHGTGTALGDPIEIEALAEVFAESRSESHPLTIGAVKSNIGHLEWSAGIAGLIKAVLVLVYESVPPNIGLKELNPLIAKTIQTHDFPIEFPTAVKPMVRDDSDKLLVAGVSSLGYSGTIAHAIIQQAPREKCRSVVKIEHDAVEYPKTSHMHDSMLFLFTGQGSQYAGMGKDLYDENQAFRGAMDQCESIYKSLTEGESLLDTIFNTEDEDPITTIAQPALVALEWSLVRMWQSNEVTPSILLGHSVGEIAAACVAGAMTIETALELAVVRARLVHQLPSNNGTMAAVRCSMTEAKTAMSSCLSEDEQNLVGVASANGPNSVVISGVRDVVEKVLDMLGKTGVHLQVSHAFHSPLMRGMEVEFSRVVESLDIQQPLTTPIASTVAGRIFQAGESIDVEHWVKQLTSPVLFEDAFKAVMTHDEENDRSRNIIVEVGPKSVLSKMARSWWKPTGRRQSDLLWAVSMEQGQPSTFNESLQAVCEALESKTCVTSTGLGSMFPNRTRMPWPESPPHPLLQHSVPIGSQGNEFHTLFHDKLMELYSNYLIAGQAMFPSSGYIEMGLTAGGMEFLSRSSGEDEVLVASVAEIDVALPFSSSATPLSDLKDSHTQEVSNIQDHYSLLAEAGYQR